MRPTDARRIVASRRRRARRPARGQALIFSLLFLGAAALVVLLMFNSAILTTTKTQLQNAADAGAYSAALLQARDANFSAYTNRAIIANQVAVAQFVSLKSYFDDAGSIHGRLSSGLDGVYRSIFPSSAPAWDLAKKVPVETARKAIDSLAPTAVKALDALIFGLMEAQQLNHKATTIDMMLVADDVVKKNDPLAGVTKSAFMLGDAAMRVTKWDGSQKQFKANDTSAEANRYADLVVNRDTTDAFIRNRDSIPTAAWASSVKFCFLAVKTTTVYGFAHVGATQLSTNKKRWLAMDADEGAGMWSCTWVYPCPVGVCSTTIGFPLADLGGSGGAVAGANGKYDSLNGYRNNPFESDLYGGAAVLPPAGLVRYFSTGPGTTLDSRGGLQDDYRDVASPMVAASKPANQSAELNGGQYPITIEVERTAATLRDSTQVLPDSSQLRLENQVKGGHLRALASAEAYFYRPRTDSLARFTRNGWHRADNKTEYQNLFSPYWQARLAPTTLAEEIASAGLQ